MTRTFTSAGLITIPEEGPASPYPSTLLVQGLPSGRILDINLTLNGFSHEYPNDVAVLLVSPNGVTNSLVLANAGGGNPVTNLTLTFDDQAPGFLSSTGTGVSGIYKPSLGGFNDPTDPPLPPPAPLPELSPLRGFNGTNPNGFWSLYVVDLGEPDVGSITSWSLTIRARIRVPRPRR